MDQIQELLENELVSQFETLSELEPGTEERSRVIDDISTLYKLRLTEKESDESQQQKKREMKAQMKDRWTRIGMAAMELILPLTFYGAWVNKGLRFEESGTFTSQTFRNLIGKLKPMKK